MAIEPNATEPIHDRGSFTGYRRARTPTRSVVVKDRLARFFITVEGVGSIVAVSLVGLFLVYVVIPLFKPPEMRSENTFDRQGAAEIAHLAVNEYLTMVWTFHTDGSIEVRKLDDGQIVSRHSVFGVVDEAADASGAYGASGDRSPPLCWSFPIEGDACIFGFADGSVRIGTIGFATEFLEADEVPERLLDLDVKSMALLGDGVVQRTPENQFRRQSLVIDLQEATPLSEVPILVIDQSQGLTGPVFAALDEEGVLHVAKVRQRKNLLTGKVTTRVTSGSLDLAAGGFLSPATGATEAGGAAENAGDSGFGYPEWVLVTGIGDNVMLAWDDGRLLRVDISDISAPAIAEEVDLVSEPQGRLTALAFQIGKASLISGDDSGRVRVWFRVNPDDATTIDGTNLVLAHELQSGQSAVTALAASARTRMIAAGFADGTISLHHITSNRRLAEVTIPGVPGDPGDAAGVVADAPAGDKSGAISALALAPRDDQLVAGAAGRLAFWQIDAPHPETSFKALLQPVWYEGYNESALVWQSSAGTDSFEPKYSLYPLIFGTLKATFYSLLFGLPLALIAAIHTSEFLHPRVKARVKPIIEMMASLPSVVLGFLAALVFAPFIEKIVPQTLAAFITIPFALLFGAQLWQLLPQDLSIRWQRRKLWGMLLMLPVGLALAVLLGPLTERVVFAGDIMLWLDGQIGSGLGGWLFILLPLSTLVVAYANSQQVDGWLRGQKRDWSRFQFAVVDLLRFLASVAATLAVAVIMSWLLSSAGWDPRGSYVGTYVQRNALIVGVVMGFAIIPIIYTISEDALSAVPDHLRAASLGAGATPWQTAVLVIVPTAMSGLFSATMIGLGRAVGETMIVLMAAGNTPIMDWNIFNGFRTLSANIAVELPEAVQNSTHYRTLFLAALTLFIMTFIINTFAEAIRIRFRKKAFEL